MITFNRVLGRILDPHPKQKTARPRSGLPTLEALEDRTVPTVAFTPHFSGTSEFAPSGTTIAQEHSLSLSSPPVVLLFAGSYWNTFGGQADQTTLTNDIQSILNSPYLSALTQYGSDGHAVFNSSLQDNSTPPLSGNTPAVNDMVSFIRNTLSNHGMTVNTRALYFIINDPNSGGSSSGTFGFNWTDSQTMHAVYVGAKFFSGTGTLNVDAFTQVFSHELAEAMAPYVHVNDPGNLGLGYQIADGEPENFGNGYATRVNGVRVQAYWSQRDGAWVVPDGNQQKVLLSWSSSTFDNTFSLSVTGDQLGTNYNDDITIDRTPHVSSPSTGTRVTMNGENFDFDSGQIRSISVNSGGGFDAVRVNALDSGQTLSIFSLSSVSFDQVDVGENGSLADIKGTINVSNSSGHTDLRINDSQRTQLDYITVTSNSVNFEGGPTINYSPSSSLGGVGVEDLEIDDPIGQTNFLFVQSLPSQMPFSIYGNSADILFGAAAGQVLFQRRN
jgi:hypothetical protein